MLKAVWFQIHWFLGITAGIVLAVVGVTGGMLSLEDEILTWMNPGVRSVLAREAPLLAPDALLAEVRAQLPDRTVTSVTVTSSPTAPARVQLSPAAGGGGGRGETRYVNPYDGQLLGAVQGQDAFRFIMRVHRWLAAGEVGKQIVGASTVALIILSATGLYLRWPRKVLHWRSWFRIDFSHRGRSFLWALHSVIGTWVLPFYLLASLTGLYWSYDWYRSALYDISGTPRPQQGGRGGAPQGGQPQQAGAPGGPAQAQAPGGGAREGAARSAAPDGAPRGGQGGQGGRQALDIAALWPVFVTESGGYSTATLRVPQGNAQTLAITYQPPVPAHERANNNLVLDATGTVREHRRYEDLPTGQKLMGSILPLHAGSYFGLPGLLLMMIASLLMPLFAITGWMLYLDRRRKKGEARAAARALAVPVAGDAPVLVAYASQTGTAERLAWQSASALRAAGIPVKVAALSSLRPDALGATERALFVVSTFGEGEPPDDARAFARRLAASKMSLDGLDYGLLALGDRTYPHFCEFGTTLDGWLRRNGAKPLFEHVLMDGADAGALDLWQQQLKSLTGGAAEADFSAPALQSWRLTHRRHLNPGGAGLPTFHVALEPDGFSLPDWQAGDIAEIAPEHAAETVLAFLAAVGLDPDNKVRHGAEETTLAQLAARSLLPPAATCAGLDAQSLANRLTPLPRRDYSIASIPADGRIELLVRQTRTPDGGFGLGSGWLTDAVPEGGQVSMRIRSNSGFHAPDSDRRMILIGNGTGLAGLRSHLKARIHGGQDANWLLFGERSADFDFYFRDEITAWQSAGGLQAVDLAFSRDQNERVYVQDRLKAAGARVIEWVQQGAAIYVCGSAEGMAESVHQVLTDLLTPAGLEALTEGGRYRRDVY